MVGEHDGLITRIGMLNSSQEAITDLFYISTGASFVVLITSHTTFGVVTDELTYYGYNSHYFCFFFSASTRKRSFAMWNVQTHNLTELKTV
jgi:hypothetical protein